VAIRGQLQRVVYAVRARDLHARRESRGLDDALGPDSRHRRGPGK
jgi:hypothetical protein